MSLQNRGVKIKVSKGYHTATFGKELSDQDVSSLQLEAVN